MSIARMLLMAGMPVMPVGQQAWTTYGTYTWVVPAGVTEACVLCVGAGGAGGGVPTTQSDSAAGGGGGALSYTNNLAVTPGESLTVVVGRGYAGTTGSGTAGGDSQLKRNTTVLVEAKGGGGGAGDRVENGAGNGGGGGAAGCVVGTGVCSGVRGGKGGGQGSEAGGR